MRNARTRLLGLALVCLPYASACGDDSAAKDDSPAVDAGTGPSNDASVAYQGPTRGGALPDDPAYEEPPPDDGPFDASIPCCEAILAFAALDGETALVLEADAAPLDGAEATLADGRFTVALCVPQGVAVRYRLHVTRDGDGGPSEGVRVDSTQPSFEDEEGATWNLLVEDACD